MPPDPFADAQRRVVRAAAPLRHHAHSMAMAPMERLAEFHHALEAGHFVDLDEAGRAELMRRRLRLIDEEHAEVVAEIRAHLEGHGDLAALAKELADLLVVVFGTAEVLAIPLEAVFVAVMESNMTKIEGATFDAGGKLMKGERYAPPDIAAILDS